MIAGGWGVSIWHHLGWRNPNGRIPVWENRTPKCCRERGTPGGTRRVRHGQHLLRSATARWDRTQHSTRSGITNTACLCVQGTILEMWNWCNLEGKKRRKLPFWPHLIPFLSLSGYSDDPGSDLCLWLKGKPWEAAPDTLITGPSDLENCLCRLVSQVLSYKNHPAELSPEAMALQLQEAQVGLGTRGCLVNQKKILYGSSFICRYWWLNTEYITTTSDQCCLHQPGRHINSTI